MPTARRQLGDRGEQMAAEFLEQQGYQIIERNFLVREGEIDIVAKTKQGFVFVEVKTRRSKIFGEAVEAITAAKEQKLLRAAKRYLLNRNISEETPWRIDVIAIDLSTDSPQIDHLENAFA